MNALVILKPFVKPILALLCFLCLYFAFQHYIHLQQKVSQLETTLTEKQDLIDAQNRNIANIKEQITSQAQAISDLQEFQDELQLNSEQRKITIKEILNHDQDAKTWASQPVPDAIRSLFNNTGATNVVHSALSGSDQVQ